jgi:hypothetical protein
VWANIPLRKSIVEVFAASACAALAVLVSDASILRIPKESGALAGALFL